MEWYSDFLTLIIFQVLKVANILQQGEFTYDIAIC